MTLLNIAIHFAIGMAISLLGFYFFRKFIRKYFTKHLTYIFLSYWAFCILIFLFLIGSGGATFYIDTTIWYEFGSFIGAFLLAATLLFQIRSFRRQQVEAKFFEMVKYYRDNVVQMKLRNPFHHNSHEETHAEGRRVLKVIFDQYKVARGIVDFEKVVDSNKIDDCFIKPKEYNAFFSSQSDQELSAEHKKMFIENEIAYLITYWGVSSGTVKEIENWLTKQFRLKNKEKDENDYPELQTELIRKIIKCVAFYKCDCNKDCHSKYTDSIYTHLKQTEGRSFIECKKSTKKTKFFGGHQYQLGHYFRHLFQAVKFIDQQPAWLFSKVDKYEYAKILRAQMSNYEQALLFINSLTVLGRNWEYNNKEGKRLISEYHMIKNLPQHFIPNMNPKDYYPDVNFEWKENDKNEINLPTKTMQSTSNQTTPAREKENHLRIEEVEKWRKEISTWNLLYKKYPPKVKLYFWSLAFTGTIILIAWIYFKEYNLRWLLLVIPALNAYLSYRLSKSHIVNIFESYRVELQIEPLLYNKNKLSLIQQKIIEKKIGSDVSNQSYIEFLLNHIETKKQTKRFNYPTSVWFISVTVSAIIVASVKTFSLADLPIAITFFYVIFVIEIFIRNNFIDIYKNRYNDLIKALKNIQLNNLSKKG
ncbi:putative phage abortive infection protein [Ancylomarina subtilis]|uniref:Putative phage abortive infection protein n=1 Tax=Ancylomarina subtilis TaxID=1639035 RepID=A0A4V2FSA5_9BACT|nr:putative phage abortive infection protein [Ancylomarina subtilis]RZT93579.1 putative phage abortive infection protein [Ancylomarina subtilis]